MSSVQNMDEKPLGLYSSSEPIKLQKSVELRDVKGDNITIDDVKATLTQNFDLIQRAINGESKAFNELYVQSYNYVFFVIRQYIPDDETTYDAMYRKQYTVLFSSATNVAPSLFDSHQN